MSHGAPETIDTATWLGPDPALALVTADMTAWLAANPCSCAAGCECDE